MLGYLNTGGRRRIAQKVAVSIQVCSSVGEAKGPPHERTPAGAGRAATNRSHGERRHVTVMLCDLVDSTGTAAKLDAEEWRDLVGFFVDAACSGIVETGGKKELGGLMAVFSVPWHRRTIERTVRAALAIQHAFRGRWCVEREAVLGTSVHFSGLFYAGDQCRE
jgi:class 3 adenylate cyclase